MTSTVLNVALGIAAGLWTITLLRLARTTGIHQPHPHNPPVSGSRWMTCHNTPCGHTIRRHTPTPDGAYQCTGCHTTTREDQDA